MVKYGNIEITLNIMLLSILGGVKNLVTEENLNTTPTITECSTAETDSFNNALLENMEIQVATPSELQKALDPQAITIIQKDGKQYLISNQEDAHVSTRAVTIHQLYRFSTHVLIINILNESTMIYERIKHS